MFLPFTDGLIKTTHFDWEMSQLADPKKIASVNPGYCFKKAGWKQEGFSKTGKVILAKSL